MIKSMTGFGRAEFQNEQCRFTVEMKSVNHRYLDFNFKIPKKMGMFEPRLRNLLKSYMLRGKVDVFITYESFVENRVTLKYSEDLAGQYLQYMKQMSETFGLENGISAPALARFPEVLTMEERPVDEDKVWEVLEPVVKEAAEAFVLSREKEGDHLKNDIMEKLELMEAKVDEVESRAPSIVSEYREKLEKKMQEILEDTRIEESRIAAEVVIFADKIATDEETVRLRSHIINMRQELASGAGVGRKLDFIAQEMNREANTILSKANDMTTSNAAIELKTEIEKVREQIQNIE